MNAHLRYASYVARHKWFVLMAGLKTGAPLWRLLIHDWTKLLPCEWFPYVRAFNTRPQIGETLVCVVDGGPLIGVVVETRPDRPCPRRGREHWNRAYRIQRDDGRRFWVFPGEVEVRHEVGAAFDRAWLHHLHANPHHHQHWVLREDSGVTKVLQMPEHFVREMVADWAGAGRAITGKWEVADWYAKNGDKMLLHPATAEAVNRIMRSSGFAPSVLLAS